MRVDEDAGAEHALRALNKAAQAGMVGPVQPVDAGEPFLDRNPAEIDLLPVADDPGDGAEPAGHTHRAGIGEGWHAALEHARIEFVGLAVDVEIGARKLGNQQRRAERDALRKEPVDIGVLRAPEAAQGQARRLDEAARIAAPGMRHVDHHRHDLERRLVQAERPLDLGDDVVRRRRKWG